jgi:LAO/AO transport system kinase
MVLGASTLQKARKHKVGGNSVDIAEELLAGSRLALTRAITAVENEDSEATAIIQKIFPHIGRAHVIGVTGPPGAGKSTLVNKLAEEYRHQGKTIGIIAVDPTSPFTGGAILGDRIRMNELTLDEGVFIRSMATRGSLGGLSRKTADVVKLMDAFGRDMIFIETVGVGQAEVDIASAADSTIVVLVPGLGDDIQAIKAGILEIGDIFAINKADRDGVDRLYNELAMMLDLGGAKVAWRPPIIKTVASVGTGIVELMVTIDGHMTYLSSSGELAKRRTQRTKNELVALLEERIRQQVFAKITGTGQLDGLVDQLDKREKDPYSIVAELLTAYLR